MHNMDLLVLGLEYIEEHIKDDIKTQDIALACHCSKSTLEKLFQCVNGISVHSYIVRRRMMLAAAQESINLQNAYADSLKIPREVAIRINQILDRIKDFEDSIKFNIYNNKN